MASGTAWQVIGYVDLDGEPQVEETVLVRTADEGLVRFLTNQFLMWQFARKHPEDKKWRAGHSACLHRGRCEGPLDTGLWIPAHRDDPVADVAYLDTDTGSVEWQANAPTYRVLTQQPGNVIPLPGPRR
jgi:hypothetical protein